MYIESHIMRSISVKMWAKFSYYDMDIYTPKVLTKWAIYAIYEDMKKIPQSS